MGIRDLWKLVNPTGKSALLSDIATHEAASPGQPIVVGVDAEIWMNQAQAGYMKSNTKYYRKGENAELLSFIHRAIKFLEYNIIVVFVFDGPSRPMSKRGKSTAGANHWLVNALSKILPSLGFYIRKAPGDAEAELALMSRNHLVNIIVTNDSDVFIFGGLNIIPSTKHSSDEIDATTIFTQSMLHASGLSAGGLLLIALLCRNDFGPGLAGCGIETASELAKGTAFGPKLLDAARAMCSKDLEMFLVPWRLELANFLSLNIGGVLSSTHPALAEEVHISLFPNVDVVYQFVHPITSWSQPHSSLLEVPYVKKLPNLQDFGQDMADFFSWARNPGILCAKLSPHLFKGYVYQCLLEPYDSSAIVREYNSSTRQGSNSSHSVFSFAQTGNVQGMKETLFTRLYLLKFTSSVMHTHLTSKLPNLRGGATLSASQPAAKSSHLWVPEILLSERMASKLLDYKKSNVDLSGCRELKCYSPLLDSVECSAEATRGPGDVARVSGDEEISLLGTAMNSTMTSAVDLDFEMIYYQDENGVIYIDL